MNPTGETDLKTLLKSLTPTHQPGDFVFCSLEELPAVDPASVIMTFREKEGVTLVLQKAEADRLKLDYSFVAAWITLEVHSSLAAVGLTAAFSTALADEGISCNVVAASYHDHLFVPKADLPRAMAVLKKLSALEG